jgi:branched-chain amino acid transport system substrate-binding protein
MQKSITLALIASLASASNSLAADKLKLGFITVLSGPLAITGSEQRRGLDIAIEHLGGKIGGIETEIIVYDDKGEPGEAAQGANKLIDRDQIQIATGFSLSNTMMAAAPPMLAKGVFVIGANAGPSTLAGASCHPNLFVSSFHNDQWDLGVGQYMRDHGRKRAYFMGMDYQAGWEHTKAAIRGYGGPVVAEIYTPMKQLDFSAELTQLRAANPDSVYAFYVGSLAVSFLKQYAQAGLQKRIPLYSMGAISDPTLYEAQGDAAVGIIKTEAWNTDLDNPANKRFVESFVAKFGREPTGFAARQYDAVNLIDSAVKAVKGNLSDKDGLRAAFYKADFNSVRGSFRFNTNHYPIQNIYVEEVVKTEKGQLHSKLLGIAIKDIKDPDYEKCKM